MTHLHYFGTDGIRGIVGKNPITPDFLLKLGWAIGSVLGGNGIKKIIIGRDTRISGCMLQSAVESGILSSGISTLLTGCIPTSAVSYLTYALDAAAGLVISASHNCFDYNGIKIFSANGIKLTTETELSIEKKIKNPISYFNSIHFGRSNYIIDAINKYITFCKKTVSHDISLSRFKIVLDCANGSTYHVAPIIFKELGADVKIFSADPNGININKNSGSTNISKLKKIVVLEKADIGLAFDGDGDRVIMVDHLGNQIDGDQIIYIIAREYLQNRKLYGGVVGTIMSNTGLIIGLKKLGIPFSISKIGDRYIYEKLKKKGWIIGGENSGHIILLDKHSTGDGIIASLQILCSMINNNISLHNLSKNITLIPQVFLNVYLKNNQFFKKNKELQSVINDSKKILGPYGRILLRQSGTEPCVRIMIEGRNYFQITALAQNISKVIKSMQI